MNQVIVRLLMYLHRMNSRFPLLTYESYLCQILTLCSTGQMFKYPRPQLLRHPINCGCEGTSSNDFGGAASSVSFEEALERIKSGSCRTSYIGHLDEAARVKLTVVFFDGEVRLTVLYCVMIRTGVRIPKFPFFFGRF